MKVTQAFICLSGAAVVSAQSPVWGQCGGQGWTGPTTCASGSTCTYSNAWYSQCIPGGNGGGTTTTAKTTTTSSKTTTTSTRTSTSSTPSSGSGKTRFAGVNLAGFDFGMATTGTQDASQILAPDNAQIAHFVNDDKQNIFRLPTGWQFLVGNVLGGTLNSANFARYDSLMQACLNSGAYCIIDIHNYARWNGGIVGQGGPTNAQLADVWRQLASKYAGQSRVIFGIMNEPHDVPSITTWAATVQACVTAIRNAGATSQMILLPGNNWTSASEFVSSGSLSALSTVTNLDGSKTNLIFDIHKYLDSDNSGTHTECVTNNIDNAFAPLATALRNAGRQALLSESGGGNVASCVKYMCEQLAYLNANSDVYLGWTGWSAGAFQPSWNYILTLVPTKNGNSWTDTTLMNSCFKR